MSKLNQTISVRIDEPLAARLQKVSDLTKLKPGDIMRSALEGFITKVERDGKITFTLAPTKETAA